MTAKRAQSCEVLIVGASGLVGGELIGAFPSRVLGTYHAKAREGLIALDIRDREAVAAAIRELDPACIVHCAALTDVNRCEAEPELSRAINLEGTRNVAAAAAQSGARLIFVSTDYVFGGERGPHLLGEPIAPMNVYGAHKAEAEQAVANLVEDHVILRGCNLYGYQAGGKNFAMAVFELGRRGAAMRVPVDQWGSPTLARDMVLAVKRLVHSPIRGALHIAGPDYVSRLEWARRAARAFGLSPEFIEGLSTAELTGAGDRVVAPRPARAGLDAAESAARLGLELTGLDGGLAIMRSDLERAGLLS